MKSQVSAQMHCASVVFTNHSPCPFRPFKSSKHAVSAHLRCWCVFALTVSAWARSSCRANILLNGCVGITFTMRGIRGAFVSVTRTPWPASVHGCTCEVCCKVVCMHSGSGGRLVTARLECATYPCQWYLVYRRLAPRFCFRLLSSC